jgi:hypothetical protein
MACEVRMRLLWKKPRLHGVSTQLRELERAQSSQLGLRAPLGSRIGQRCRERARDQRAFIV